jgi:hypothetical protein
VMRDHDVPANCTKISHVCCTWHNVTQTVFILSQTKAGRLSRNFPTDTGFLCDMCRARCRHKRNTLYLSLCQPNCS